MVHRGSDDAADTAEHQRLRAARDGHGDWRLWGPYLPARQWGTVREDYSADGDAWAYFPFDHAHLRAYRWGEDGIAGLSDSHGFLNLALAAWNGKDKRLKERLFGLTNPQGNHGEDAKEYWWHLDATPTHSYAQALYRYPQAAFPYTDLVAQNAARGRDQPEYELADTGVLDCDRFFDITVTHAKAAPDDICVEITATNHGPDPAPLHLVPQLWFRSTWAWGRDDRTPSIRLLGDAATSPGDNAAGAAPHGPVLEAAHAFLGTLRLHVDDPEARALFCDNETDDVALYGSPASRTPWPKDGIDRAVVHGDTSGLNPAHTGTKAAIVRSWDAVAPGASVRLRLRLRGAAHVHDPFGTDASTAKSNDPSTRPSTRPSPDTSTDASADTSAASTTGFDAVVATRRAEADEFYAAVIPASADATDHHIARRAFAGLLWGRKHYRYSVREWLEGDPGQPPPPPSRTAPGARNTAWRSLALADVISMPDEWEYPWFATWDLAFHCVTLAHVDPDFAKEQLLLLTREWAQGPDGALPAYEWAFGDVNPPVHAWAAWQVYVIDGAHDHAFLVRVLDKLLLNYAWWQNRKDPDGTNLYAGGFLGMDNIGLFDRSRDVPAGWRLEQSDSTAWMAFYSLSMMRIALELARHDDAYGDLVTTFLERFCGIADAMGSFGSMGVSLWDDADCFFYDVLVSDAGETVPLRLRSLVGLLPLLAVDLMPKWATKALPELDTHLAWLQANRPELMAAIAGTAKHPDVHRMLRLVDPQRLTRLLDVMLDESQLLSPHGIRSLSAAYRDGFTEQVGGRELTIRYDPGESSTGLFGGNSNWRGPVWLPVNVLLISALRRHAAGLGDTVTVELPRGSGRRATLAEVADELQRRLVTLFRPTPGTPDGPPPSHPRDQGTGPLWTQHPTFSEYFDGDTGRGLGASHQTGWTALVAHLICSPDGRLHAPPPPPAHPSKEN
ncbi:glucosidase [Terrabacter sp. NPDC080008]|uniref:MGH1-like glycoside hydrolase domain-containing protein n=1 Tax=Terrabacter sp. NPDC080008 TaxID=3155176 RepID=UPI00344FA2C5